MAEEGLSMLDDILRADDEEAGGEGPDILAELLGEGDIGSKAHETDLFADPLEDAALAEILYAPSSPLEPAPPAPPPAAPFLFPPDPPAPVPPPRAPSPVPADEEIMPASTIPAPQPPQRTRYFIIKSYSAENVTISLRRGIWATQKQNEQIFNDAFLDTPRVMMIFSINGSRHFQGYARMTSLISPKQQSRNRDFGGDVSKWGSTFTLTWERVGSVSFGETDRLRNPLADNLPLTRARDGQEVTERIGEELCRLIDLRSVPLTPDIEFPITEAERECLLNDPRASERQRNSLRGRPPAGRGYEPYPSRSRPAPPMGFAQQRGDRDRDRDRDRGRFGRRDDRWNDMDRDGPAISSAGLGDFPRLLAPPSLQDAHYGGRDGDAAFMTGDLDLTQLTYEEYLDLKQQQQQRQQQLAEHQRQLQSLAGPPFLPRDLSSALLGVPSLPQAFGHYGSLGGL